MLISAGSLNKKITVYKRVVTTLKGKSSVSYHIQSTKISGVTGDKLTAES